MFKFVYLFAVVLASPFAYAGRSSHQIFTDPDNTGGYLRAQKRAEEEREYAREQLRREAEREERITEEEARIRAEEDRDALRVSERSKETPEARKQRQRTAAESRVTELEAAQTAQWEQREAREKRHSNIKTFAALSAGGTFLVGVGWAAGDPYMAGAGGLLTIGAAVLCERMFKKDF